MAYRGAQLFDVDGCLQKFQDLPSVRRNLTPHMAHSPTSVAMSEAISAQATTITTYCEITHSKKLSEGNPLGIEEDDHNNVILNNTSTLPPESQDRFLDPHAIEDDADSPCEFPENLNSESTSSIPPNQNCSSIDFIVKPLPIRSSNELPLASSTTISQSSFKPII